MLNTKGILAKLFSAVLALGMVIQPITPVASPIIVFAEGEGGTTETPTGPVPSPSVSPTTSSSPETEVPGKDEGQTPGTGTEGGTTYNTGTGETETPENPGYNEPAKTAAIVKAEYDEASDTVTVSAVEGADAQEVADFFNTYGLQLVATVVTNNETVETDIRKDLVESTNQETGVTASVNMSAFFVDGSHVKVSDLSVVVKDNTDETINAMIDTTALEDIKKVEDQRETTSTVTAFENETEKYGFKAVVKHPKEGQKYTLRLTNNDDITNVIEVESAACVDPFAQLTITVTNGFKFDDYYTAEVLDGDGNPISVSSESDLILNAPKYQSINWVGDADSAKVQYAEVVFDKAVYDTVELTLGQTINGVPDKTTITGEKNRNSTNQFSYLFELNDVSAIDTDLEDYSAGTAYFFCNNMNTPVVKVSFQNYDHTINNADQYTIDKNTKIADSVAPKVISADLSVGDNATANSEVTLTVKFSEPLKFKPELLYTINDSDAANPYKLEGQVDKSDNTTYVFTFTGNEGVTDLPQVGQTYKVIGYTATDDVGNNQHDPFYDNKVSKTFTIDRVSPVVSDVSVEYPTEPVFGADGTTYYKGAVSIKVVTNEKITGTLTYKKDTSEEPVSVALANPTEEPTGNYTYTITVNSEAGASDVYSNFGLSNIQDAGKNTPGSIDTEELATANFGIDYKAPDAEIISNNIQGESYAKSATFEFEAEDGNGAGIKSATFELKYEDTITTISSEDIKTSTEEGKTIYTVTLNAIRASSAIVATFTDNLDNVSEPEEVGVATVVEDVKPEVVRIIATDEDVYSKEHKVQIYSEDTNGDVNSGIQSITYKLYESERFDSSNLDNNTPVINITETGVAGENLLEGNLEITLSKYDDGNFLDGTYYLYVTSTDLCGNVADYKNVTLNFDNTAPEISDIVAPDAETYQKDHDVQIAVKDTLAGIDDVTVTLLKDGDPVNFTVVDENGDILSDSKDTYPINDLGVAEYISKFTIKGSEDGLDGTYVLQISASDKSVSDGNVTTGEEIKTISLNFDNTAPVLVNLAEVENDRKDKYTQTKTVTYTVTDELAGVEKITFTMLDSEDKPVDEFTVTDAEGNVLLDSGAAYPVKVDDENKLNSTGEFTIYGIADGLNGDFKLQITAVDRTGNAVAETETEAKLLDLHFDNSAPAINNLVENNDDSRLDKYDQKQKVDYTVSDTYAGVQNIRFELYKVNENNEKEPAKFRVEGADKSETFHDIPVEDNDAARNVENSLTIDGSVDNLNGEYILKMITTDWADNVNTGDEIKEVTLYFDNTPMEITVNYISDAGAYEEVTDENITNLYYNQPVEVRVTVKDNVAINGDAEDYDGFQFTTTNSDPEGERNVVADSKSDGLDAIDFTTSFTIDPSNKKAYYETLKNWYSLTTLDGAGNGSNVTVKYVTATGETKSTTTKEVSAFEPTNRIIVDMVNPTYEIALGTTGKTYTDADDVVNKEYFGTSVVGQLKPTVTFAEGNFADSAYQFATVSDTSGDKQYENVSFDSIPDAEWHGIGNAVDADNKVYSVILPEDLDSDNLLPDGVYRFAVRGTDKAGNALVQSSAEKGKADANASSMVTEGTYWTGYKIVDTKVGMNFNIKHSSDSDAYYSYQNNVVRGNMPNVTPTATNLFWSELTAYISVSPNTDIKELSETEISFKVNSSARQYDKSYAFNTVPQGITLDSAQQKFNVYDVVVTDRAGNRIEFDMRQGDDVYLDVDSPEVDLTVPTVHVTATPEITARANDGRPLFNGPVTLHIYVEDPNGEISSGLKNVKYELTADGEIVGRYCDEEREFTNRSIWEHTLTVDPSVVETNNITLTVSAEDNAGNKTTDGQLGTTQYNFGIDVTAPVVEISFDNNSAQHDKYFKENRVATVKVTDRNINTSLIEVHTSVTPSGFSAIQNGGGNGVNDYRTFTIPYTADGDYTLNITGTDALGNRFDKPIFVDGTVAGSEFTIDKTTPVINVSFNNNDVRNGKYYNAARVATVTIDEHNFLADEVTIDQTASIQRGSTGAPSPSGFGTSGDTHTATINYAADGNYTLTVSYTDMAGNEAEQVVVPEFTIDTTKPVVRFDENTVTDNMATNDVIAPSVIFDDTNFDANGINVTLTGARVDNHNHPFTRTITQFGSVVTFSDFARVKESDDIYTAKATITCW